MSGELKLAHASQWADCYVFKNFESKLQNTDIIEVKL